MQITRRRKIECRVTNTEWLILKNKAKQAGVSLSELIRASTLNYDLSYKLTEDEIVCYKELTNLKNNFQRISNFIKYKANQQLLVEIQNVITLVTAHLKKFE